MSASILRVWDSARIGSEMDPVFAWGVASAGRVTRRQSLCQWRSEPVHEWPSAALSVGLACSRTTQYAPRARPPSALHLAIPEQAPPLNDSDRRLVVEPARAADGGRP